MKRYQLFIAIPGAVLWIIFICNYKYFFDKFPGDWLKLIDGYVLGFIMTFFGGIFWEIIQGNIKTDWFKSRNKNKIIAAVSNLHTCIFFAICFAIASLIFLINIFKDGLSWQYFISVSIAGIVVNQGILKIINQLEESLKEKELLMVEKLQMTEKNKEETNSEIK
ncbi:hypothetical protein ACI43T_06265 [Neisseria oralis]|uniref:Uncharacterized protein n=2 Tax=Neisseria TaxID=482 RepID=A0ABW8Q3J0_9NEIS